MITNCIGFYTKEFKVIKENEEAWITENMLPRFLDDGFKFTEETKTVPCPPDWVVNLQENGILLLDDYSRS